VSYVASEVIEALTPLVSTQRREKIETVLSRRISSVTLGVEDLYHEHNGAACIRTAEGLGIHNIYAAEVRHPYPYDAERQERKGAPQGVSHHTEPAKLTKAERRARQMPNGISMYAHRWVNLETFQGDDNRSAGLELVQSAQQRGYKVFGAGPRGQFELSNIPVDEPILLLFGNEASGLREDTMRACDDVFRIPMYGFTESFNISVSVGMTLEQIGTRRRSLLASEGREGDLSETEQRIWTARWLARDLKRVDLVLARLLTPVNSV
jgi:tRNA (guanosine-2'-O-)-methyltransferase